MARRVDLWGWLPSWDTEWTPETLYQINDVVVPTIRNGHVYIVSVSGTSGTDEPIWPIGQESETTADGVTYTEITGFVAVWYGEWDFNRAAAEGWRIKAGMVSNRHTFGSNQGNYNPEQIFDHCMKMADYFAAKQTASVVLATGRWDGQGRLPGAQYEDAK